MSRVLLDGRCPVHGRELVEVTEWSGDETATWIVMSFSCDATWPPHHYRAESDGAGGFVPVDDEADD